MGHTDLKNNEQPRRRVGCLTLVLDRLGRVLFVQPTYKDRPILPGGAAHEGERLDQAAARELREETGLSRVLTHFFAVDQTAANPDSGSNEGLNLIFDGGTATAAEVAAIAPPADAAGEIAGIVWLYPHEFAERLRPETSARVRAVLAVRDADLRIPLLFHGKFAVELIA